MMNPSAVAAALTLLFLPCTALANSIQFRIATDPTNYVLAYKGNLVCGCVVDFARGDVDVANCRPCTLVDLYDHLQTDADITRLILVVFETKIRCKMNNSLPNFEEAPLARSLAPYVMADYVVTFASGPKCSKLNYEKMRKAFVKTMRKPYDEATKAMMRVACKYRAAAGQLDNFLDTTRVNRVSYYIPVVLDKLANQTADG
jgi:hypothetical protein